jgi:hypothetical protein
MCSCGKTTLWTWHASTIRSAIQAVKDVKRDKFGQKFVDTTVGSYHDDKEILNTLLPCSISHEVCPSPVKILISAKTSVLVKYVHRSFLTIISMNYLIS